MRLCIISPKSHLYFGDYGHKIHMALTHLIMQEEELANEPRAKALAQVKEMRPYARYFSDKRSLGEDVILDNSAFELEQQGRGLDPEPVLKAAAQIDASEVIATDVLRDGDATVKATRNFIKETDKFYLGSVRRPKIMAVPQGKSSEEWFDCYLRLLYTDGVDTIGFSKIGVPECFATRADQRRTSGGVVDARLLLCDRLTTRKLWPSDLKLNIKIHLLGGDNHTGHELAEITREQRQGRWRDIRSNDTSAPVWYGAHGQLFDSSTGKAPALIFEKPDLENHKKETSQLLDKNKEAILSNIAVLLKHAGSSYAY